jgi:hypothetical protein
LTTCDRSSSTNGLGMRLPVGQANPRPTPQALKDQPSKAATETTVTVAA